MEVLERFRSLAGWSRVLLQDWISFANEAAQEINSWACLQPSPVLGEVVELIPGFLSWSYNPSAHGYFKGVMILGFEQASIINVILPDPSEVPPEQVGVSFHLCTQAFLLFSDPDFSVYTFSDYGGVAVFLCDGDQWYVSIAPPFTPQVFLGLRLIGGENTIASVISAYEPQEADLEGKVLVIVLEEPEEETDWSYTMTIGPSDEMSPNYLVVTVSYSLAEDELSFTVDGATGASWVGPMTRPPGGRGVVVVWIDTDTATAYSLTFGQVLPSSESFTLDSYEETGWRIEMEIPDFIVGEGPWTNQVILESFSTSQAHGIISGEALPEGEMLMVADDPYDNFSGPERVSWWAESGAPWGRIGDEI